MLVRTEGRLVCHRRHPKGATPTCRANPVGEVRASQGRHEISTAACSSACSPTEYIVVKNAALATGRFGVTVICSLRLHGSCGRSNIGMIGGCRKSSSDGRGIFVASALTALSSTVCTGGLCCIRNATMGWMACMCVTGGSTSSKSPNCRHTGTGTGTGCVNSDGSAG